MNGRRAISARMKEQSNEALCATSTTVCAPASILRSSSHAHKRGPTTSHFGESLTSSSDMPLTFVAAGGMRMQGFTKLLNSLPRHEAATERMRLFSTRIPDVSRSATQ